LQNKFGITVDKEMITVKGRELVPPTVIYKKGASDQSVTPADGGWLMKGVKVCKSGTPITTWTYLVIGGQAAQLKSTVENFAKFLSSNMGVAMSAKAAPSNGYSTASRREDEIKNVFQAIDKLKPRPQFLLVLLPEKEATTYNLVKKFGDVEYGIPTSCVQTSMLTKEKGQFGYFANVGLKVNLKFGGTNHRVQDDTKLVEKTMFMGYDVTHPTNLPGGAGDNAPSLVGLVASIDKDLAQWPAVTWENKSRVERVGDDEFVRHFKDNIKGRLQLWRQHNKSQLPENIVIFRDGVSEGQFSMVLEKELPHIRDACREMYPPKSAPPRISLIVSVKRHQTRFYPTDAGHIHFQSKSPKEGTIVDRGVTNARYWDFFLQAHASLKGKSPCLCPSVTA
jgi:eukaryotic translation initiation factor 2C